MEDEGTEEGEISDSESDGEIKNSSKEEVLDKFNKITWPPGKWRLAKPYLNKASCLFMRFATKGSYRVNSKIYRRQFFSNFH